ncbi:hypothetical protein JCM21900_003761 [Sporobolomyces salmonicolor]
MSVPALPPLPSVTQISKYVTRVLGQNPGKFTLQGTNTYLIHHPSSPSLILLDLAQGIPSYLPHLRSAILSHPTQPARVTDILISHWHHDHTDGLSGVLALLDELDATGSGVRVWKHASSEDDRDKDEEVERKLESVSDKAVQRPKIGSDSLIPSGRIHRLEVNEAFHISAEAETLELQVVHTPGHTTDSISLLLRTFPTTADSVTLAPPGTPPLALFTFDTVLGHGTAVFSDLSAYMTSLGSLISLLSPSAASPSSPLALDNPPVPIYPGHGEVIVDGLAKLREYKRHREEREEQVVEALREAPSEQALTARRLTDAIYGATIPSSLKPAAMRGLLLHLAKLERDGVVLRREGGAEEETEGVQANEVDLPEGWWDAWTWVGGEAGEAKVRRM